MMRFKWKWSRFEGSLGGGGGRGGEGELKPQHVQTVNLFLVSTCLINICFFTVQKDDSVFLFVCFSWGVGVVVVMVVVVVQISFFDLRLTIQPIYPLCYWEKIWLPIQLIGLLLPRSCYVILFYRGVSSENFGLFPSLGGKDPITCNIKMVISSGI